MSGLKDFIDGVMRWGLKDVWLAVLLLLVTTQTTAQMVFNKTYFQDRPSMRFSSVSLTDTAYMVMGVTVNKVSPYTDQALFMRINYAGEIENYQAKPDTNIVITGLFWNTLQNADGNSFVFTGYGGDTTQHLVSGIISKQLDTIAIKRFYIPNTYALQGLTLCKYDQYYFIAGVHNYKPGFDANVVLLKMDSIGNILWHKFYDQWEMDFAQSLTVLNNGNLMLGAERNDLGQPIVHSNTWLLEVDTGGNIVRQWFDPNDSTYVAEGLRQTQDGGFIYGAQKKREQSVNDVYKTATIVKLDSNFNKQWVFDSDTLSPTGFTDIEILPDGSYIACGTKNYRYAWIVKLSATGQKLWSKQYVGIQDWGSQNFLTDIDVLPDGGLIAVGQCQLSGATPPQVGWFLKLDSNGCEVENCLAGIDGGQVTDDRGQIQVWPNPASGVVTVMLPDEMREAEVKIFDVAGKVVKGFKAATAAAVVDVSDLNKGLYLIAAEKEGKYARAKLVVE